MTRSIYVVGLDGMVSQMFHARGWKIEGYAENADLICFTGGADVTPFLYGEAPRPETASDLARDRKEIKLLRDLGDKVPKVGICRGGQFLNVMAGGRMFQHVTNHGIAGKHDVMDLISGEIVMCTSTHHQMIIPSDSAEFLGMAREASEKHMEKGTIQYPKNMAKREWDDAEVLYYKHCNSLCFQPHPEYVDRDDPCQDWFFSLIELWLFDK